MATRTRSENAVTNVRAVRRCMRTAPFLLTVLPVCLAIGGCPPGKLPDFMKPKNDPNAPSCTVQFVNTSPYDAAVVYYIGTEEQRFEPLLLTDESRRREAAIAAGQKHVTDPVPCPEIESIMLTEVRFDLGAGATAVGATGILLQGEDYQCEDTLRFVMDYRIQSAELTLELVVPPDCNENGIPDDEDLASGTAPDCNENGVPDECDIAGGDSADDDGDGIPDECAQK